MQVNTKIPYKNHLIKISPEYWVNLIQAGVVLIISELISTDGKILNGHRGLSSCWCLMTYVRA